MNDTLISAKATVKKSAIHHFGVFADQPFDEGDIIEVGYALLSKKKHSAYRNYYFGNKEDGYSLPLGFGCIYNHANPPNADFFFNETLTIFTVVALKSIKKGEEIFIFYGDDWFNNRQMKIQVSFKNKWKQYLLSGMIYVRFGSVVGLMSGFLYLMEKLG